MTSRNSRWWRERGMGASMLIAAISTAYGVILLIATRFLSAVLAADDYVGGTATLELVTGVLSALLIGLAMFSAGIVTVNTFSAIVSARTRGIALQRLLGSTAQRQRRDISALGLKVGVIGALVGAVAGAVVAWAGVAIAIAVLDIDLEVTGAEWVNAGLLAPPVAVALTTWVCAYIGTRPVLSVMPIEALGGTHDPSWHQVTERRGRHALAIALIAVGLAGVAGGIVVGLLSPVGVVVAFFGGLASFVGLALAAPLIMPSLLRLVGVTARASVVGRLAIANARRYPDRASRMAMGVTIGVTLVMMFVVATSSTRAVLTASGGGSLGDEMSGILDTFTAVMIGLVAVSAVIAGVGVANLLTLGISERRSEFGVLRTLGLSAIDVSRMIAWEAFHLTTTGLLAGLAAGTFFGWAGAQSLLGTVPVDLESTGPVSTFVLPEIPIIPVVVIVVATALVTVLAAVAPTRAAARLSPVEAVR